MREGNPSHTRKINSNSWVLIRFSGGQKTGWSDSLQSIRPVPLPTSVLTGDWHRHRGPHGPERGPPLQSDTHHGIMCCADAWREQSTGGVGRNTEATLLTMASRPVDRHHGLSGTSAGPRCLDPWAGRGTWNGQLAPVCAWSSWAPRGRLVLPDPGERFQAARVQPAGVTHLSHVLQGPTWQIFSSVCPSLVCFNWSGTSGYSSIELNTIKLDSAAY